MNKTFRYKLAICAFALPAMIVFTIMVFYPIMQTVYRSMFDWDGLSAGKFIFFDNYKRLFSDKLFYTSLKNGLIFAFVLVIVQIGVATILALGISGREVAGKKFLRSTFFIPVVLSITVVCQLWLSMLNVDHGLINKLFQIIGLEYRQDWLNNKTSAIIIIALVNAWQYMGYHFVLLYAGIKAIPQDYYEAARIDGSEGFKMHAHITIPMLAETYKICLTMAITGGLNAFANMFIMTNGGPGTDTYTLTFMMYRSAFRMGEFGYGCASATIIVLQCLLVTWIINRFVARERIIY